MRSLDSQPSGFTDQSTASSTLTDEGYEVAESASELMATMTASPRPPRGRSPPHSDEHYVGPEDVYNSDDSFSDLRPRSPPRLSVLQPAAEPLPYDRLMEDSTLDGPWMEPLLERDRANGIHGQPLRRPPPRLPPPRISVPGLPSASSTSSDMGSALRLMFPPRADYQEPYEALASSLRPPAHINDEVSSEVSDYSNDADTEPFPSVSSPSVLSDTSDLADIDGLPTPTPDALHIILVGHKPPLRLKQRVLESVFAYFPGRVAPRPAGIEDEHEHSDLLQYYDYRQPELGIPAVVDEMRVYDLTGAHDEQSYYLLTGKMITPTLPVLTIFFIDPALYKARARGFFPSVNIGKSVAVVLPRSSPPTSSDDLTMMGSEHSELPQETDWTTVDRAVEAADLMAAQHILSGLKFASLFEGVDVRHVGDFERQVYTMAELWSAAVRYDVRAAATRLVNPALLLASVVRTNSSIVEPAPLPVETSGVPELAASIATVTASMHTARGSLHSIPSEALSAAVGHKPFSSSAGPVGKEDLRLSLWDDATTSIGNMYFSKYTPFMPDWKSAYAGLSQLLVQHGRSIGAIAFIALAVSAFYLGSGSAVIDQPSHFPSMTPPPAIIPTCEIPTDTATFTQRVQGMDIPRATPLLGLDGTKKPLGLSGPSTPLSISGSGDFKTLDNSLLPLPLNNDLITVNPTECTTCFQLVGSARSKDTIHLGGTTTSPKVKNPSQGESTTPVQADLDAESSPMALVVKEIPRALGTYVEAHTRFAMKNVRALNRIGGKAARQAIHSLVTTLNGEEYHDTTQEADELPWYDELVEGVRHALAERRARKELIIAEEDAERSKRPRAGKLVQEFLCRGAHAMVA